MEWISVKDRLPEEGGKYLCYRYSYMGNCGYCDVLRYGIIDKEKCFYFFDLENGDVPVGNVTHWMELPEPPKGGLKWTK